MHHIIDLLQLAHPNNLKWYLNQPPPEEINRLGRILAIPNVRTLDGLHPDDGLKHRRAEECTSWQANSDDSPAGAHILGSLLEGFLVDSDEEYGVGARAVFGARLNVFDHVLRLGEVDKVLCTQLASHHLFLLVSSVDTDDSEAHSFCILAGERAETTAGTDNRYGLAWSSAGFFEAFVDGDTGTEDRCNGVERDVPGYSCNVGGFGNAVLLEGAVDSVAGEEGFRA